MPLEDLLLKCRLCQAEKGTIEITSNAELVNKIFECTRIKIEDECAEKLPKSVCNECSTNVNFMYDYVGRVKETDAKLRAALLQQDTLKTRKFKCPECRKAYVKRTNLQMHKKSHSTLFCFTCELVFDDKSEKSEHTCNVNNIRESVLPHDAREPEDSCDDSSIEKSETSELHAQEDNNRLKGGFVCKICQEMFVLRVDFWLHRKTHKSRLSCKWDNCDKICSSPYALKTHEMKHEGKKPFLCVTCGKAFLTKNSLNCHEKIHLEVKGYVCKICNIGFSVRSNLRAHEKKHHEGVRFYCSQCTRAFITKCSLDRHERIHTGIKEYQCQTCPSAFYTSKELQKHQRYHQGLRQHKCEQCFKTFFEKHHLTVHLRSHTGERPYVCKITGCNKSFAESQKLSRHVKAKHSC